MIIRIFFEIILERVDFSDLELPNIAIFFIIKITFLIFLQKNILNMEKTIVLLELSLVFIIYHKSIDKHEKLC